MELSVLYLGISNRLFGSLLGTYKDIYGNKRMYIFLEKKVQEDLAF
jgi:hypothetical protein